MAGVRVLLVNGTYEYYQSLIQLVHNNYEPSFFEVIVLALLTFSMYEKFSKNTNFSQPLIST